MQSIGLVSVIMAAYNAQNTIEMAIQSVLSQTYTDFELLIIDDCSTDKTVEVIRQFNDDRIRLLHNDRNKGVSKTRYYGVQNAKGTWIAILDSDDMWIADKLERQIELQKQTNAQLLFTGSSFMDADSKKMSWILHVPEQITYKELLKQNVISNSSVLVQKKLFLEHTVLKDNLHEDFACWLAMLKADCTAYGVDEPLLVYRLSANSKSGNKINAAKMNWNTYRYCGLNIVLSVYYMFWYGIRGLCKYRHLR